MNAVLLRDGNLQVERDHPFNLLDGEIEIQVLRAGICETDLQLVQGYMGFNGVLGHEFVGVAQSGPFKGQRVAGEINCACGKCSYCSRGLQNHCLHRSVVGILKHDGAFAEKVSIPQQNLHLIPNNVTDDQAIFVEPLAAAFQIPAQIDLDNFGRVIVLGDGRLGNLCAQVIAQYKVSLLVIGKHEEKLKRLSNVGIETALLGEVIETQAADLVVDCTGSRTGLETALQLIRPRGTIVLKSTFAGSDGPNLAELVIHEINVIGSRCGPFDKAIEALSTQSVNVNSLVTGRFDITDAIKAFEKAKQKDQLKIILDIAG